MDLSVESAGNVCAGCAIASATAATSTGRQLKSAARIQRERKAKRSKKIVVVTSIGAVLAFTLAGWILTRKEGRAEFQQEYFDRHAEARQLLRQGRYEESLAAFANLEALHAHRPDDFSDVAEAHAQARHEADDAYARAADAYIHKAEILLQNGEKEQALIDYRTARDFILSHKDHTASPEMLQRMESIRMEIEKK